MNVDRLWKLLDTIQAQIRVFDTKAQIVIAIDGILAGFFGSQTVKIVELLGQLSHSDLPVLLVVTGVTCLVALGSSLMFAVNTVYARLHLNQPGSRIFFAHICKEFGQDYGKAGRILPSLSDEELSTDLSNQVLANSIICATKAERFRNSLWLMSIAVILWLGTLVLQGVLQHRIGVSLSDASGESALRVQVPAVQNFYFGCCKGGDECEPKKLQLPSRASSPRHQALMTPCKR